MSHVFHVRIRYECGVHIEGKLRSVFFETRSSLRSERRSIEGDFNDRRQGTSMIVGLVERTRLRFSARSRGAARLNKRDPLHSIVRVSGGRSNPDAVRSDLLRYVGRGRRNRGIPHMNAIRCDLAPFASAICWTPTVASVSLRVMFVPTYIFLPALSHAGVPSDGSAPPSTMSRLR